MVFKKKTKTRTRIVKVRAKRRSSNSNTLNKVFTKLIISATYGAMRPMIAQRISPLVQNIPAGQYADEIGMLILTSVTSKFSKGIIRDIADAGFMIESAFLGQQVGSQLLSNNLNSAPSIRSF